MQKPAIILTVSAVIASTSGSVSGQAVPDTGNASRESPTPERKAVDEYSSTVVTPVLDHAIIDGQNLIWCASFQLAWNELCDVVIKSDIEVVDGPAWVSILNSKPATKDDLASDAYVALAGSKKDNILGRINEELKRKFSPPVPEPQPELGPQAIVAYAYMRKTLRFAEAFDSCKEPMQFQGGSDKWNVVCFGVDPSREDSERSRAMRRQVSVVSAEGDECIAKLTTEGDRDDIILAKVKPERTLSATVDRVLGVVQNTGHFPLHLRVPVWIPKVSFNLERSFDDLIGKLLGNPEWSGWYIDVAKQQTQFYLDERGAILSSEAQIHVKSTRSYGRIVFDRPFLILLRQTNRERPYFAAWIGNGELLVKP